MTASSHNVTNDADWWEQNSDLSLAFERGAAGFQRLIFLQLPQFFPDPLVPGLIFIRFPGLGHFAFWHILDQGFLFLVILLRRRIVDLNAEVQRAFQLPKDVIREGHFRQCELNKNRSHEKRKDASDFHDRMPPCLSQLSRTQGQVETDTARESPYKRYPLLMATATVLPWYSHCTLAGRPCPRAVQRRQ